MIQDTFDAVVLQIGTESVHREIEVELAFDEENDPLALMMIFKAPGEEETCWIIGRELAMLGVLSPVPFGPGDVRFRADFGKNQVIVCLKNPQGHSDIAFNRDELIDFFNRTHAVCKLGEEPLDHLIDQELEDLLS